MVKQTKNSKRESIIAELQIPGGIEIALEGNKLTAKGAKGAATMRLAHPAVKIAKKENMIVLTSKKGNKKNKRMINSFRAHIANLLRGAKDGYNYTLKICSGHFPMTVKQEGQTIIIANFLGEKIPRVAKILPGVKVNIAKDKITVEGTSKEDAGQTAANLEIATNIRNRDRRVFQDGIFIIEKPMRMKE